MKRFMGFMLTVFLVLGLLALAIPAQATFRAYATSVLTIATDNTNSASTLLPTGTSEFALEVPTITSGTVQIQVSQNGTDWLNLQGASLGSGTGGIALPLFGATSPNCFKYFRVVTGAAQGANRTFILRAR